MRQVTAAALVLLVIQFLLPMLLLREGPALPLEPERSEPPERTERGEQTQGTLPIHRVDEDGEQGELDRGRTLSVLQEDGRIRTMTVADYLWGVVAAEMPASFEPEALKAQAVAARTYCMARGTAYAQAHPLAQVCTDSACCQAWISREEAAVKWGEEASLYTRRIQQAVTQTDGLGVVYGGQPIQALFFSSARGCTTDAQAVWGEAVPYLVGVTSPEGEEVPDYRSELTLSAGEVKERILEQYPGADLSGPPEGWLTNAVREPSGVIRCVDVGGVTLKGGEVRRLLALRSACFTLSVAGDQLTFHVTGYGHGVGMSQYGANAMAREGKDFREILTWYYTGTQVAPLW